MYAGCVHTMQFPLAAIFRVSNPAVIFLFFYLLSSFLFGNRNAPINRLPFFLLLLLLLLLLLTIISCIIIRFVLT